METYKLLHSKETRKKKIRKRQIHRVGKNIRERSKEATSKGLISKIYKQPSQFCQTNNNNK